MPYDRYGRWYPGYEGAIEYGQPEVWGQGPADEEDGEHEPRYRTFGPYGPPVAPRPYQRGELLGRPPRPVPPGRLPGPPGGAPALHSYHYPYYGYGYSGYGQFGGGYGAQAQYVLSTGSGPYVGVAPRGYVRSDERIREDVNEALTQDPWLDPTEVEVEVENGVVTLTGAVDSRGARRRAAEDAWHVRGVRDVRNALRVRATGEEGA
ncbi:MAG: BON domain-containing protein [Chloroflexota bacterium]